jgi:hypothetical protein
VLIPGVLKADFDISHLSKKTKLDLAALLLSEYTEQCKVHGSARDGGEDIYEGDNDVEGAESSDPVEPLLASDKEEKSRAKFEAIDVVLSTWKLSGELIAEELVSIGYDVKLAHEIEQLYRRRDLLLTNDLEEHIVSIHSNASALSAKNQETGGEVVDNIIHDGDDSEMHAPPSVRSSISVKDQARITTAYVEDTFKRRLFRIPKYFSVITIDLWWAAASKKWLKTIRKEMPEEYKVKRPTRVVEVSSSANSIAKSGLADDDDNDEEDPNKRVCCGLLKRSSYLLAPTLYTTPEEKADYKKWKTTRMPSYLRLLQDEAAELQMMTKRSFDFDEQCTIPLYCFALPVFCGFGHLFTEIGRKYWFIVYLKFSRFLLLIAGCWTGNMVKSFGIEPKVAQYSLHSRLIRQEEREAAESVDNEDAESNGENGDDGDDHCFALKFDMKNDYSQVLYALIATRAVLFQVFPYGSILTVFASLTANTPLFVRDKELHSHLHPLLYSRERCIADSTRLENNLIDRINAYRRQMNVQQTVMKKRHWLITLQAIQIFFLQSRLMAFLYNFLKFIIAVSLVLLSAKTAIDVLEVALILSLPFAIASTFPLVILLGKAMRITDDDLIYLFCPFQSKSAEDKDKEEAKDGEHTRPRNDSDDAVINPIQSRASRVGDLYSHYEYDKEEEAVMPTNFIPERLSTVSLDETGIPAQARRTTIEMRQILRTGTLADPSDREL